MAGSRSWDRFGPAATALKFQGQYLAGPPSDTSGAIVKELVGAAAVVADCNVDPTVLDGWGSTNQVVKAANPRIGLLRNAKVELIGGTWKMTEFTNVGVTYGLPSPINRLGLCSPAGGRGHVGSASYGRGPECRSAGCPTATAAAPSPKSRKWRPRDQ